MVKPEDKKTISDKLNEIVEKGAESYNENSVLRAAIVLIPHIGSSLDVLISTEGQKIIQKRRDILIKEVKVEMETVKKDIVRKDFLDSEEFFDLIVSAFESAVKTREVEKIKLYAKIVKNSVIIEGESFSATEYIEIISELSWNEFIVACEIYKQQSQSQSLTYDDNSKEGETPLMYANRMGWDDLPKIVSKYSILSEDLPFIYKRIERTGLISEEVGSYMEYKGGVYIITNAFRKIMEYLK